MIVNRSHLPWALFTAACTAVCGGLYIANFHPELLPFPVALPAFFGEVPPIHRSVGGTPLGLLFGAAALAIFVFAALLGARKKKPLWRLGHPRVWLRAHIWLTILTIPLIALHSGFRLGGPMTTLLTLLYAFVMGSGFYGLALQQFMPRLMRERLQEEVVFEQIPYIRGLLVAAAEKFRGELVPPPDAKPPTKAPAVAPLGPDEMHLLEFLDSEVLPYLKAPRGERLRLGAEAQSDSAFRLLKISVPEARHPQVDDMQGWCDNRRRMDLQTKLHHWLHGWLLVHVPLSFILLILAVWHAAATVFFF